MKFLILSTIVISILIKAIFFTRYKNNACKTFEDYYNDRDNNENCYYNPDQHLLVPDIIKRLGYPLEVYSVTTKDGYVLTMFRIPHGKDDHRNITRTPILLQHGYGSNSVCFVSLGENSLGFMLADQGYDVWLGNFRGSKYSLNHTHISASDNDYWNFSLHEYGVYDLDAQIEFVSKTTNRRMICVGFSMGTTSFYVYSSMYPSVASKKVAVFINLAPSPFLIPGDSHLKLGMPYWPYFKKLLFVNRVSFSEVAKYICYPHVFQLKFCFAFAQMLYGFNSKHHDPEYLPVSFISQLDTFAVKPFDHMMQVLISGTFKQYDYGLSGNKNMYGSINPPQYELSHVKVPSYFIRAKNDLLITKEGAEKLYKSLPQEATPYDIHVIDDEEFSHLDFVMGKNAVPLVYDHIVQLLRSLPNL